MVGVGAPGISGRWDWGSRWIKMDESDDRDVDSERPVYVEFHDETTDGRYKVAREDWDKR